MVHTVIALLAFSCFGVAHGISNATLRDAAAKKGIFFGSAINAGVLAKDVQYGKVAQQQYDLATAENACKWQSIQRRQGEFDFTSCDQIRNFSLHQMQGAFRGHNLCWGKDNPGWLKSLGGSAKKDALIGHIQAVAKHYGSDAFAWDVVNEAVTDDHNAEDPLKASDWYPDVPDFVDVAFSTARSAFPKGVKLFLNDYNIASLNGWSKTKADRIYNLAKGMLDRKVPIDGVGFQLHINSEWSDTDGFKANMQRLGELGLEVHITELDISCSSWSDAVEQQQAKVYANILQACIDVPACKSFETWGFTDKYTWKGTTSHPLPFDENFKPKAAVSSMMAVLTGSPPAPSPPTPPQPRSYETLTKTCQNSKAMSGKLPVVSVAECQRLCDARPDCTSVDTNGSDCYLKTHCEGQVGQCSGWCGYRVKGRDEALVVV